MPFANKNKQDLRAEFVVKAARGTMCMTTLCAEYSISRPTGYKWLERFTRRGLEGLDEESRRPHNAPHKTCEALEQTVVRMRRARPDWGARKIHFQLKDAAIALPIITIHRILKRQGLIAEPKISPSQGIRFERSEPNQLWQMDFKGPLYEAGRALIPLSVIDDHSRYVLGLREHVNTRGEPVRASLEDIFMRHGVPEAMLMDHGTPWWNSQGRGWTWLTVWLMKQGVRVCLSGIRHPQTQGKVERFHGSLKAAWACRGPQGEPVQSWLDAYRWEHNQIRPHVALGDDKPAQHWHPSPRRYDPNPPQWDYGSGAEVRRLCVGGHLWLHGKRYEVTRTLAGEWVKLERIDSRVLVFFRKTLVRVIELGG